MLRSGVGARRAAPMTKKSSSRHSVLSNASTGAAIPLGTALHEGDVVAISHASSFPTAIADSLANAAENIPRVTVLAGLAPPGALSSIGKRLSVRTYGLFGTAVPEGVSVSVIDYPLGTIGRRIEAGSERVDVAIMGLPPSDGDGYHSFGPSVDYMPAAVRNARLVLAQVNPKMPTTRGSVRIHESQIDGLVIRKDELPSPPDDGQTSVVRRVAENVASLVPDGATLQVGVGGLANSIGLALRDHRNLGVHSGLVGDWLLMLKESGSLSNKKKDLDVGQTVTASVYGSKPLYSFLVGNERVRVEPVSYTHDAKILTQFTRLVCINSSLEVDLIGQANSQRIGGRRIGGIGGQPEFMRAASSSPNGRAILAVPSTALEGRASRIVPRLSGPVTTPKYDIDFVVTEHGVADLRDVDDEDRVRRLIDVADPRYRAELMRAAESLL